ncbi:unnamed protein product, partial [marine sediment metagenome]
LRPVSLDAVCSYTLFFLAVVKKDDFFSVVAYICHSRGACARAGGVAGIQ